MISSAARSRSAAGVGKFVGDKLKYLVRGFTRAEAETKARRQLDKIPGKCSLIATGLDTSGVVVPDVGTICRGSIDAPAASFVDGDALRACSADRARDARRRDLALAAAASEPHHHPLRRPALGHDRRDALCFDGVTPVMPNVETRLAAAGVKFTHASVTTALCCPSRSSILEGRVRAHVRRPLEHAAARRCGDLRRLVVARDLAPRRGLSHGPLRQVPERLQHALDDAGDAVRAARLGRVARLQGAALLRRGPRRSPAPASRRRPRCSTRRAAPTTPAARRTRSAKTRVPNKQNYATDVLAAKALDFIDQSAGQPFLLYFAPYAPHSPFCAAPGDENSYASLPGYRPPNWNTAPTPDTAALGRHDLPDGHGQAEQHRQRPPKAARVAEGGRPRRRGDPRQARGRRPGPEHARALHRRQRLLVGRALPSPEALPLRRVHARAARRLVSAAHVHPAHRRPLRSEHRLRVHVRPPRGRRAARCSKTAGAS